MRRVWLVRARGGGSAVGGGLMCDGQVIIVRIKTMDCVREECDM